MAGYTAYSNLNLLDWSGLKASWCLQTGLCSQDSINAAKAYYNPEIAYPSLQPPPAVGTPSNIITPNASSINDILAKQMEEWQAQNQATIDTADTSSATPDRTWMIWVAAGAGLVLLLRRK